MRLVNVNILNSLFTLQKYHYVVQCAITTCGYCACCVSRPRGYIVNIGEPCVVKGREFAIAIINVANRLVEQHR